MPSREHPPLITLHLPQSGETFVYEMKRAELRRVRRYFNELVKRGTGKDFIVFETADRQVTVAARGRAVRFAEVPNYAGALPSTGPFPFSMKVHMRDNPDPLYVVIHEPSDAAWFVTALDTEPMPLPLFWPAENVHGELVTLASPDIVLAEVSSEIVDAGLREMRS